MKTLIILVVLLSAATAFAQLSGPIGTGEGPSFSKFDRGGMGLINNFTTSAGPPPVGCASPTAPNGVVDMSLCSNAFYVAVIF